ncbi:MAG: hypothetical protein KBS91_00630 [Firmicutes bacterium]|nr:hypothetical protein [Candidatus Caballimonas caccae]
MKLKEIVKITAMYLGRNDVISYLDSTNGTANANVLELINNLTRCANLVINELALSYIPMYKEENVNVLNNKINYSSLDENVTEIVAVYDEYGNDVHYVVYPEYIECNVSSVKVRYKYLPSNYGLNDDIGYSESQISSRIIAYGTASEYCLLSREYQESLMWRNRFNDGVSCVLMPKNGIIKNRRFCL